MRYVGLLVGFGTLLVIAVVIGAALFEMKVLRPRRSAAWENAKESARWEDAVVTKDGRSQVVVRRVARLGHRREVVDQQFVGSIHTDRDDYQVQLDKMWAEAKQRVYQLNTGPLS